MKKKAKKKTCKCGHGKVPLVAAGRYGGLCGVGVEEKKEKDRIHKRQEEILKRDPRPASLPLIEPLANPGFDATPWVPRFEMYRNIGKFVPRHLMSFTDEEKLENHYPLAQHDDKGQCNKWCWACGRPQKPNGLSGKKHVGSGKPCPVCGFRRAVNRDRMAISRYAAAAGTQFNNPEHLAKVNAAKRNKRGVPKVTELLQQRAEELADEILRPYFEGLKQVPKEEWSPATKLEFYNNQTMIAEKLMNRVEGMPVARTRHVNKEDEDVLRDDELSPEVLVQMVAAIATGADVGALLGEVHDAEVIDEQEDDNEA